MDFDQGDLSEERPDLRPTELNDLFQFSAAEVPDPDPNYFGRRPFQRKTVEEIDILGEDNPALNPRPTPELIVGKAGPKGGAVAWAAWPPNLEAKAAGRFSSMISTPSGCQPDDRMGFRQPASIV